MLVWSIAWNRGVMYFYAVVIMGRLSLIQLLHLWVEPVVLKCFLIYLFLFYLCSYTFFVYSLNGILEVTAFNLTLLTLNINYFFILWQCLDLQNFNCIYSPSHLLCYCCHGISILHVYFILQGSLLIFIQ